MNLTTAKCPACGAMHTHLPEAADESVTCPKCGAIYIPSECVVDTASAARESADAAKASEAHLKQIAQDVRLLANHLRALYIIGLLVLLWEVLSGLGGCLLRR